MKKILSFVLLFAMVTFVYGQKNLVKQKARVVSDKVIVDDGSSSEVTAPYANPKDIEVITLTKSGNMYSILDYHSNQVDYNARLNTVVHGHRSYGAAGTGHHYLDYSNDGGATWTNDVDIASDGTDVVRYPQTIILDNGTDAKVVACGWGLEFSTPVKYNVYTAISDMDGSNASSQFKALPSSGHQYSVPSDLCADADPTKFHFVTLATPNGNKTDSLSIVTGDISSGTPVLTESLIDLNIQNAPVSTGGTVLDFILDQGIAFSKTTPGLGYVACTAFWDGHQLPDNIAAGLHVWKTIDFGLTWTALPTFDWTSLSVINDSLVHEDGQPIRPSFNDFTLGVDANDKLHIFAEIQSGGSSAFTWFGVTSDDGISYNNHFYDLSTTDGTSWNANYIAPLKSSTYVYFDEGPTSKFYQTTYMKLAFSQDRKKAFYIWSETVGDEENSAPDMMAIGVDLNTQLKTAKKNLSEGTDAETACYFAFPSSNIIETGADNDYQIPIVYSEPGNNSLAELQYYYLTGAGVNNADFPVGVNNILESNIEVYPNPAKDIITIKNANISQIIVLDIYGAEVIRTNSSKIDVSNLANGTYFVNINNGISIVTKKVIILN